MKLGISLPVYNTALGELPGMAHDAEAAGFDSVWSYEVYANPYTVLGTAAMTTERIGLGTGLATAATRHPLHTANAAADVDALSGGRMLLGLGAGDPELTVAAGANPTKPVSLMREYIDQVRTSWTWMASGEAGEFAGQFFQSQVLPGPPDGPFGRIMHRDRIPSISLRFGRRCCSSQARRPKACSAAFTPRGSPRTLSCRTWQRAPRAPGEIPPESTSSRT